MTAAHKSLAFGTRVRVTNWTTTNVVVVRINDRGPYKPGRIIDLSRKAMEDDLISDGVTNVKVEILNKEDEKDLVATKTTKNQRNPKPKEAKTKVRCN